MSWRLDDKWCASHADDSAFDRQSEKGRQGMSCKYTPSLGFLQLTMTHREYLKVGARVSNWISGEVSHVHPLKDELLIFFPHPGKPINPVSKAKA